VLILGAGRNAIRFAPPLVITRDQADAILRIFDEALTEIGGGASLAMTAGHDATATGAR
jgi:acetylornithine/succinyldiaminopimelate/putrescine aminotransferase